jgi:glycosyltransferase involved in cell wall biosynthesis
LRIAIIAPPWVPVPPPAYGGTEAVVDGLARGLQAVGHEILLFATGDSTCPVPGDWVVPNAVGTAGLGVATEARQALNAHDAALEWGADVIHDHTLVGPLVENRHDVPVATTNHGPFDGELGDLYRAISDDVAVIAISHDQASRADGIRVAAIIHHGVDVDDFPEGRGDGGYALFLGRMNPDKGVHVAARVARMAGVPLKIAAKLAEPAEEEYFTREVEPLLGEGVEFMGEVGGEEKVALLGSAMCLLNPIAWAEPFGMVMVEALVCGTPVVATPCGSVPEIVDDGSTGFVRSTPEELAEALPRAAELDRDRCRAAARERFSTARMVDDHIALYRSLLASEPLRAVR